MVKHYKNRLVHEKSPYLLQHAHNPVDWFPWGEEAFTKARQEDKPIFLSIGYATCHWCHVMEKESFMNEAIAAYLNDHFVSIKVDREERPDVDMIYMNAVQVLTGQGGWPLTVFLTHDLEPFYGGTYFPPTNRYGRPGFANLLRQIQQAWLEKRNDIKMVATRIRDALQQDTAKTSTDPIDTDTIFKTAFEMYSSQFDNTYGGFGSAPKFPRPMDVQFLLRYDRSTNQKQGLPMARQTLDKMAAGGMYDQLGGGFHRYSTDERWLIPHFEKMLYDNALLSIAYTEAFQVTHDPNYKQIVQEILTYVIDEMRDSQGAFFSAQDADSEGEEGKFYVWTAQELQDHLDENDYRIWCLRYGVTDTGNFEQNTNVFYKQMAVEDIGKQLTLTTEEVVTSLKASRKKLLDVRKKRVKPITDDKILTSWNSLMISAFCRAYAVIQKPEYLQHASDAIDFLLTHMSTNHLLLHRYRDGQADINGFLEDYAFLIQALIDYYEVTFDPSHLKKAIFLTKKTNKLFYDEQKGGYFFTTEHHTDNLTRLKDSFDGAIPSGNAIMILNLLRLEEYTMANSFRKRAEGTLTYFSEQLKQSPLSFSQMLIGMDFLKNRAIEIVLIAPDQHIHNVGSFLQILQSNFYPNKVVAVISENDQKTVGEMIPWAKNRPVTNGLPTAYVCQNYTCQQPTTSLEDFKQQLNSL